MNKNTKWTFAMRLFLYETLFLRFGPYNNWYNSHTPIEGRRKDYESCLEELSKYFSGVIGKPITAEAVELQIAWATTTQGEVKQSHVLQFIHNKSSALLAGFINSAQGLPSLMLLQCSTPTDEEK
jgi:hypothetical protein